MPSLKEVRNRIASVKSTQQITSAMKMVAASKLRKAQNNILAMRPYASKLRELLQAWRDAKVSAWKAFVEWAIRAALALLLIGMALRLGVWDVL